MVVYAILPGCIDRSYLQWADPEKIDVPGQERII
jgi:hypothetical protein